MPKQLIISYSQMYKHILKNGRWVPSGRLTKDGRTMWKKEFGQTAKSFLNKLPPQKRKCVILIAKIDDMKAVREVLEESGRVFKI